MLKINWQIEEGEDKRHERKNINVYAVANKKHGWPHKYLVLVNGFCFLMFSCNEEFMQKTKRITSCRSGLSIYDVDMYYRLLLSTPMYMP